VIASMADEASKHPNLPGALEHTLTVNSVTTTDAPKSYLALNGCTNYGGRTFLSIPSGSCSSEATGIMSGVTGLVVSEARAQGLTLSTNENGVDPFGADLDTALDRRSGGSLLHWFRTECRLERAGTPPTGTAGSTRTSSSRRCATRRSRPRPTSPARRWFSLLPPVAVDLRGHVAPRAGLLYRVEWAAGVQPPAYPASDTWHVVGAKTPDHAHRRAPRDLDLAPVAALGGASGPPADLRSAAPTRRSSASRGSS
jgi:hypothetical protein